MAEALLSVGVLARRSGVPVSTLHYYESQKLLQSRRTAGNQRRYPREALRRVAFIRASQALGIGLSEIGAALSELPGQRTPTKADWSRLSRRWRDALDQRIAALQALRDQLDGCIGCGCLSLKACRLHNPGDVLSKAGSGPQRLPGAATVPGQ